MFKKLCAKNSNVSDTFAKVHYVQKTLVQKTLFVFLPQKRFNNYKSLTSHATQFHSSLLKVLLALPIPKI
jgi:hypothetical protein